ncbi:MAG: WYL domain-containing protein, partial [Propionibacteriaceae bacterium]|nr:WYL domain-containing protein [Propionibacteriaceae bacterium]
MAKRKSERLINLVICLLAARRRLTREQIRRSVEGYAGLTDAAFLRTFERDKDELRRLGVPIETGPTDPWSDEADGYRIHRSDYELPALELTAAESTLLGLAAPVWQGAALGQATGRAIAKLRAAGAEIGGERVAAVAPALPTREPAFAAFWQSWLTRTPIRFSYHGKDRVLEPWRLQLRQGSWYVFGRDRAAGLRCYRLSRVEGAPGLLSGEAPYAAASEDELAEYARLDAEPSPVGEALLAIRPDAAPALRRRGRPTAAVPDGHEPVAVPEGYEPVAVPYSRDSEVVDEACSAGVGVIVLGPPGLRVQTLERLRQVAAAGQGASPAGRGHSAVGPAAPSAVLPPAPFAVPGRSGFNPAAPNAAAAQTPHGPVAAPDGSAGASAEQAARLLLLIPYFQSRPGQSLAEAAAAFDLPPDQLRRDLSVAFLCGLPGGLPGDLIEVDLEAVDGDGLVYLSNAEVLPRPLSLRPDEAMGL